MRLSWIWPLSSSIWLGFTSRRRGFAHRCAVAMQHRSPWAPLCSTRLHDIVNMEWIALWVVKLFLTSYLGPWAFFFSSGSMNFVYVAIIQSRPYRTLLLTWLLMYRHVLFFIHKLAETFCCSCRSMCFYVFQCLIHNCISCASILVKFLW
jgi:hypothetical protein